jgi:hypothetical protein
MLQHQALALFGGWRAWRTRGAPPNSKTQDDVARAMGVPAEQIGILLTLTSGSSARWIIA